MQGIWLTALRNLNLKDQRENLPKSASWNLTGDRAMQYISKASERQETKRQQEEKYDKAKKQAVKKVKSEERKTKKVTRLTGPRLNPQRPKRVSRSNR